MRTCPVAAVAVREDMVFWAPWFRRAPRAPGFPRVSGGGPAPGSSAPASPRHGGPCLAARHVACMSLTCMAPSMMLRASSSMTSFSAATASMASRSLRVLGSVGEPLNQEAWQWFHQVGGGGQCDLVDTWWQTETGGVAIAPRPSAPGAPLRPGKPQRPMFGMNPVILDSDGRPLEGNGVSGALCLGTPWPGIARFSFLIYILLYR